MRAPQVMKSEAEATAMVARFELDHQATAFTVRGIAVWRLLRLPVCMALQTSEFSNRSLPRRERLLAVLRSIIDLATLPRGFRYAVKTSISAMRIKGESGYEDIYFERLIKDLPGGVRLHTLNAAGYIWRKSATPAPSVDCTAIPVFGALMARIFPIVEGAGVYARLSDLIRTNLEVDISSSKIQLIFSSLWWQARAYDWLLRRLGVASVLVAETDERALLMASKRQGIRFIELQHGVFTPDHPDALPSKMLDFAEPDTLLLPDGLALYGHYWADRLADTAMGRLERIYCVGASVIEGYRSMRKTRSPQYNEGPCLLVTTQGFGRDGLIRFLGRFLESFDGPCTLILKLHPAFDPSTEPYLREIGKDSRVRVITGSDDPNTYELMAKSDLHMSIASACHFDALGIGVPTLVLGLPGHTLVQDIIDIGDALFAATPEDLAGIIKGLYWRPIQQTLSDKYYRQGFSENLSSLIV